MSFKIPALAYTGSIRPITLEKNGKKVTVGGENSYPFYSFDGEMPHMPRIAVQVPDSLPEDWPEACLAPYKDVLGDPVAWAKKAQDVYKADIIFLWLKSTDPNGLNRSADEAAAIARQVLDAINIPLIVWGSTNVEKDAEVLRKVAMACSDKKVALGPVQEGNHKLIGAQALAYNHIVIASSPIDINLAKQLNILLGNLGVTPENIIIDPTTGAIGYGIEYTYSVMERIRQAALTQQDEKLQFPIISNLADEVWKTREAKLADDPIMGKGLNRGITFEAMTAVTLLLAGADILVMRHPKAIESVRKYVADMTGASRPAQTVVSQEPSQAVSGGVISVSSLPRGMKLDLDIAKLINGPTIVGPDHVLAVVRISEEGEGGITVSSEALEVFSAFLEAKKSPLQPSSVPEESGVKEKAKKKSRKASPEKILDSWKAADDKAGEGTYSKEKKKDFSGKDVELLGPTYEEGAPSERGDWRQKMKNREDMVQHLKTALRYWYSSEGYGSEKRKTPA